MRRFSSILAAGALSLALASCGGGGGSASSGAGGGATAPSTPPTTTAARTTAKPPVRKPIVAPVGCPKKVEAFIGGMVKLRRELEVGLSYEAYAARVDAIRKDYGRIPIEKLHLSCLSAAGTPAERALDRYVAAANTWNACAAEPSCGSAQIEAPLQKEWRVAADFLGEAKKGLK